MKKYNKKSVFSKLLIVICLTLIISLPASAIELNEIDNQMLYDSYEGRQIQAAILVENGVSRKLTQNEYDEILDKREKMENLKNSISIESEQSAFEIDEHNGIQPQFYWVDYSFDKWGEDHWHPRSMTREVTPKVYAGSVATGMGYTTSVAVNVTIGGSFGSGATIKNKITPEFTISYSDSRETSESFKVDGTIPKGYTGWVEFTPRMANIWGQLTRTEYSDYDTTETHSYSDSFFPTKIGDFADGIYEIVIKEGQIR